jgi:hypothetical protein
MFKGTLTAIAEALSATHGVVRPRTATSTQSRTMQRLNIVSREHASFDRADQDSIPEPGAPDQTSLRHRERC